MRAVVEVEDDDAMVLTGRQTVDLQGGRGGGGGVRERWEKEGRVRVRGRGRERGSRREGGGGILRRCIVRAY